MNIVLYVLILTEYRLHIISSPCRSVTYSELDGLISRYTCHINSTLSWYIIAHTLITCFYYLGYVSQALDLKKIKVFVLDEADVMIDTQGFKDQSIILQKDLSKACQMLLFSATYDEQVMKFAQRIVQRPNIIRVRIFIYMICCGILKVWLVIVY